MTVTGRKRDPQLDARILDVTREILREHGYAAVTIPAAARRAGVTPPTVRLRWPTKPELVHDALFTDADIPPMPDTGSLGSDIRDAVSFTIALYTTPEMTAGLFGLSQDLQRHPDLARNVRTRLHDPAITLFRRLLERAVERGELEHIDVDPRVVLEIISGAVISRVLNGTPIGNLEDDLTRFVLAGLGATPSSATATSRRSPKPAQRSRRARSGDSQPHQRRV